ncbi:hypothetical protein MKX03_029370, partial [Papaver bracteatum]
MGGNHSVNVGTNKGGNINVNNDSNVNVHGRRLMSTGAEGSADNSPCSPVSTDRLFRAIFVEGHTLLPQILPKAITSANLESDGSVMHITFAE